jgi:3-phenylpropionate/trans-cinnamate dioxygenase ferredoxin subunit
MLSRGLLYEHEVACPLHGATFDVRTGEVITPPAMEALTVYPVKIEGDDILIGTPSE